MQSQNQTVLTNSIGGNFNMQQNLMANIKQNSSLLQSLSLNNSQLSQKSFKSHQSRRSKQSRQSRKSRQSYQSRQSQQHHLMSRVSKSGKRTGSRTQNRAIGKVSNRNKYAAESAARQSDQE